MSLPRVATAAVSMTRETGGQWDPDHGRLPEMHEGDLRATALVLQAADFKLCIVSCDTLVLPAAVLADAEKQITRRTALPRENLLICATHTHHGGAVCDILGCRSDPEFCRRLREAIVRAAVAAYGKLYATDAGDDRLRAEFLVGVGQEASVGRNSRLLLKDGMIGWSGYSRADVLRPTGPCDPDLLVLGFQRPGGGVAGLVFTHSVHNIGTRKPDRRRVRSPGFYGLAAQDLESEIDGHVLFLPGAFGSTHNITFMGSGVPGAECVYRVTEAVRRALGRAALCPVSPARAIRRRFTYRIRRFDEAGESAAVEAYLTKYKPTTSAAEIEVFRNMREEMAAHRGEARQTSLYALRMGDVALVGIPGEMFASLGLDIRRRSPFRHTFVIGLANGSLGYIPDREGYELGGYQAWAGWHSPFETGTGEAMVDHALDMLKDLHSGAR